MNKPIYVGLATGKTLPLIALILLVLASQAFNTNAQTVTNLYSFVGFPIDGSFESAGLVQGNDGNFYGTTAGGGTHDLGTVFRISIGGSFTNLHSFVGSPNDGYSPYAGLVQGKEGNFYGTTFYGGSGTNCTGGCGTLYRISLTGSYTSLYSFVGSPTDGGNPFAGLVQGSDGNFYGMTTIGGTSGSGTIFRISPGGNYTNLYSFAGTPNDGGTPDSGLIQGSDGNFYATTTLGGVNNIGSMFRISPNGSYTNLYTFRYSPNVGYDPSGLVQGSDGNFYGTTYFGGSNGNFGTVFRISPTGSYTNLYFFPGSPGDGEHPRAGLVQGSDGNFYGTTAYGGTSPKCNGGCGTVFRISPSGSYTSLYSFVGSPTDGRYLLAGLVQGSDGNFYGTTAYGGASTNCTGGCGTVYRLSVPLSPPPYPINQITGIQMSGTNIIFNIPSIASETYQLQFSSSMNPTNWVNVPVSVTNSIGALLTLTNFGGASQPQGFYRFDITP